MIGLGAENRLLSVPPHQFDNCKMKQVDNVSQTAENFKRRGGQELIDKITAA